MAADTVGKVSPSSTPPYVTRGRIFANAIVSSLDDQMQGQCNWMRRFDDQELILRQAAVAWEAAKDLTIEEIEVAPPKAHEVRIEIYYTGVCHTGELAPKIPCRASKLISHVCRRVHSVR